MCTAIKMKTWQGDTCFGRTMDFSYPLEPHIYQFPRDYQWNNLYETHHIRNSHAFLGVGQDLAPIICSDGVNEKGFAAAALYFPGYAQYDNYNSNELTESGKLPVTALELVNFLLGQCGDISDAAVLLKDIAIVGIRDSVTNSVAPLHWILSDKGGSCMTVEIMAEGLHLIDNPIGVLTNSPDFRWHMANLRNYMNVAPGQSEEEFWDGVRLTPFGQGAGTTGLPGDYTPPSRFVRTAFQKSHVILPEGKSETVNTMFHLLDSVSIPRGVVMTDRGTPDYTQYTVIMNLNDTEYFFKTYDNSRIFSVRLQPDLGDKNQIWRRGALIQPDDLAPLNA